MSEPNLPTSHTTEANAAVAAALNLDKADFERAARGLVAQHPTGRIGSADLVAWDTNRFDFIRESPEAPPSVNPSLWRQARLNSHHGLFEVAPGCWQARGYDLSNVTFISGAEGWVVIDPLTTEATAAACLQLANEHLGSRPVTAVIYTHSHVDHFGGVHGVTSQEAVDRGDCRVIAPEGFLWEAVSENVIAGMAMARRAAYQFGATIPSGPFGHVDSGLGQAGPVGSPGLIAPTEEITRTGEELDVDGVRIVFQSTPDAEAPAEMNFFFPDGAAGSSAGPSAGGSGSAAGWLCMAENCTHNMHNLVPIRGAQVRDSLSWSKYIGEAIELFGADSELMFASHHWPRWGRDDVAVFLRRQRDLYRYIHDQTMRWANHGLTATEIAEEIELPAVFAEEGHTRGYYGSLVHNVKAVYQRYLSWYDGNPARLHQHPPVEAGTRYVELAGGADALLAHARSAYEAGDYRWVAEVVNHLVFAQPDHTEARQLQAAALEQMGYQAESATFRNAYLTGAKELRQGPPPARPARRRFLLPAMTLGQVFDLLGIRLMAENVDGQTASINWRVTNRDGSTEEWALGLEHSTLNAVEGRLDPDADATLTTTRDELNAVLQGSKALTDAVTEGTITLDGDPAALALVFGNLDTFESGFAIVEP